MLAVVLGQLRREDDFVGEQRDFFVWLDDRDFDIEGGDLIGERVAEAFEGPDGRGIHGHAWRPDVPANAG